MSCLSVFTCISVPVRSVCPVKDRMIPKTVQDEDNLISVIYNYSLGLRLRFRLKIRTRIRFRSGNGGS